MAPYIWICALSLAIYGPTLFFRLVFLDDNVFFSEKLAFLSDWSNLPKLFSDNSFLASGGVFYRPVLILSMMADAVLGRGRLPMSHGVNILLHAAASCLFYALLRRLGHKGSALALALLFCAHPVSAQAVAWLPGRTDTLLAVFVLSSMIAFIDFSERNKPAAAFLHWAFFTLALLTKELAVVLPPACLLYLWARPNPHPALSRAGKGNMAVPERARLKEYSWITAGWIVSLIAWHFARRAAIGGSDAYTAAAALRSLAGNLPAALSYVGKMTWPAGFCGYPILKDMPLVPGAIAFLIAAIALAASSLENRRLALWGLVWSALFLLPSFVYPKAHIEPVFFEYRAYLPLIGFLAAWGEIRWLREAALSRAGRAAFAVLLALFAAAAFLNSGRYRDGLAYWSGAARCSPRSAFARKQLGVMHYFRKSFEPAEREYRAALALNPAEPMVHNNLGVLYLDAGRLDLAEREFSAELAINPDYEHALFNLGLVSYRQGRLAQARALWERTLRAHPGYSDAARYLEALRAQGK